MPATESAYTTQPSAIGTAKSQTSSKTSNKPVAPSEYSYDSDGEVDTTKAKQQSSRSPAKTSIFSKIKGKMNQKAPKQPTPSNRIAERRQARADTLFAYMVLAGGSSARSNTFGVEYF
ncbi:hypothetical protein BJ170DRAFT_599369 [Xylariales sp. AK1849]|nr:hypothetical protein BJ170DRAFT_599369 [Xylariales sp. AK1849]